MTNKANAKNLVKKSDNIVLKKLKNGITLALDPMKDIESAMLKVCFPVGSKNETKENNGISHFLEHMAFKGTKKRTYKQIAEEIDNIGGIMNAYTSYEATCYYIKVIGKDLEKAFDVLSDILQNSTFDKDEIEKEKGVILQELSASLDSPQDVVFDMFMEKAATGTPLEMTILGPAENIKKFQKEDFVNYINKYYRTEDMIIGVTGKFSEKEVHKLATKYFGNMKSHPDSQKVVLDGKYTGGVNIKHKNDLEQVQFILGFEALSSKGLTKEYFALQIASDILGSGMSSRLFQEVREKAGLVYSIGSWYSHMDELYIFAIQAGTAAKNINQMCHILDSEIKKFIKDGIKDEELNKIKTQVINGMLMQKESVNSRNRSMIGSVMIHGKIISDEEIIERVNQVTKQDVVDAFTKMINKKKATLSIYGTKINEKDCDIIKQNYL